MIKALIMLSERFEELSLFVPWYRLREEGVDVTLASPMLGCITGLHGYRVEPDCRLSDVTPTDYDLLIVPDGPCCEFLRLREEALDVARTIAMESRVVSIGHGAQVLMSAGALDGKTVTASPGIRDDLRAAGAAYRDEATVLDGNILTCRGADDLPELTAAMMHFLQQTERV
jgi:protease I